jgi:hypothetical protein
MYGYGLSAINHGLLTPSLELISKLPTTISYGLWSIDHALFTFNPEPSNAQFNRKARKADAACATLCGHGDFSAPLRLKPRGQHFQL